jgi:uncharacterized membrane protein
MKSSQLPMKVGSEAAVANGGASVVYTAGITVMLAFLYAAQSIAVTYSKDDPNAGTFSYDPNSAVMSTEMLKLCLASGLFYRQLKGARSGGEMPGYAFDPKVVVKVAIPALIYMAGNNILFIALKYLDAPTYQVLGNIKIIVVAIIQRLALKSQKTVVQWLGVALLMLGMMVRRAPSSASPPLLPGLVRQAAAGWVAHRGARPPARSLARSLVRVWQVIGASKLDSHEKGSAKADTLMLGLFWMVCIACVPSTPRLSVAAGYVHVSPHAHSVSPLYCSSGCARRSPVSTRSFCSRSWSTPLTSRTCCSTPGESSSACWVRATNQILRRFSVHPPLPPRCIECTSL